MVDTLHHQKNTEPHSQHYGSKLAWLRAAVMGANDGIVSIGALVVGVASASNSSEFILTAGIAGVIAGAISMGLGEFVSVSTQRDTELALIAKEKRELKEHPELELAELAEIYAHKGLSPQTARLVAQELTDHDPIKAHLEAELGINEETLTNPWYAAYASAGAFLAGAILPMTMIILPPPEYRIPITFAGVIIALILNGTLSAYAGGSSKQKATVRIVFGGVLAMAVTLSIGKLFGVSGI